MAFQSAIIAKEIDEEEYQSALADKLGRPYESEDKTNGHECTSNCRREGCPLCIHGVHEDLYCAVCDKVVTDNELTDMFGECGKEEVLDYYNPYKIN